MTAAKVRGLREPFRGRVVELLRRAAAEGLRVEVTDGYRTVDQQRRAYNRKPSKAALPGQSRHQLGLAVDLEGDVDGVQRLLQPLGLRSLQSEPWHVEEARALTALERAELSKLT